MHFSKQINLENNINQSDWQTPGFASLKSWWEVSPNSFLYDNEHRFFGANIKARRWFRIQIPSVWFIVEMLSELTPHLLCLLKCPTPVHTTPPQCRALAVALLVTPKQQCNICGNWSGNHPIIEDRRSDLPEFWSKDNSEPHSIYSRGCPSYRAENEVQKTNVNYNCTYL